MTTDLFEPKTKERNYRVLQLRVENVQRAEAVTIEPTDDLVVIAGDNDEGKSSTLLGLAMALCGKAAFPEMPIHRDHAKALVNVVIGADGVPFLEVELELRRGAPPKLTARRCDKKPIVGGVQGFLDELVGHGLAFHPFEFAEPPGAKTPETVRAAQLEMIARAFLPGFDIAAHNKARKLLKEVELRDANRDVKHLEQSLPVAVPADEALPEPLDIGVAEQQLRAAEAQNLEIRDYARRATERRASLARVTTSRQEAERTVARLKADEAALIEEIERMDKAAAEPETDTTKLRVLIDEGRRANQARREVEIRNEQRARDRVHRARAQDELKRARDKQAALEKRVEEMDAAKAKALSGAQLPAGLSFDENCVLLNGLPFEQASESEQHLVSLEVGAATCGRLAVVIEPDLNKYGMKKIQRVRDWAKARDVQVWGERVATDVAGSFVIAGGRNAS